MFRSYDFQKSKNVNEIFFIGFAISRRYEIELFNASQLLLDQNLGFINTIILISSSSRYLSLLLSTFTGGTCGKNN